MTDTINQHLHNDILKRLAELEKYRDYFNEGLKTDLEDNRLLYQAVIERLDTIENYLHKHDKRISDIEAIKGIVTTAVDNTFCKIDERLEKLERGEFPEMEKSKWQKEIEERIDKDEDSACKANNSLQEYLEKRIEILEEKSSKIFHTTNHIVADMQVGYRKTKSSKIPHICPGCNANTSITDCFPCEDTGIVWETVDE